MKTIDVVKIFKDENNYKHYRKFVNREALPEKVRDLLVALDKYYKDHEVFNYDTYTTYFFQVCFPDCNSSQTKLYNEMLSEFKNEPNEDVHSILKHYRKEYLFDQLLLEAHDTKNINKIKRLIEHYQAELDTLDNLGLVDSDPLSIYKAVQTEEEGGLEWFLPCLQDTLKSLIRGRFVVLGARTNVGKTSFVANQVAHTIQELKDDECVVWLNNEGRADTDIFPRLYSVLLNKPLDTIWLDIESDRTKLLEMGVNKVKLFDFQGKTRYDVVRILEEFKPKLLILDLIDHIKGFKSSAGETVDAAYNRLYQWTREISCQYCPVIGTSQLNVAAADSAKSMFPPLEVMVGSTTAKQAAAHAVLMLGYSNDEEFENSRFLSTPKIKSSKKLYKEVHFQPETGIFQEYETIKGDFYV